MTESVAESVLAPSALLDPSAPVLPTAAPEPAVPAAAEAPAAPAPSLAELQAEAAAAQDRVDAAIKAEQAAKTTGPDALSAGEVVTYTFDDPYTSAEVTQYGIVLGVNDDGAVGVAWLSQVNPGFPAQLLERA